MSSLLTAVVVVGRVWKVTAYHFNRRTPGLTNIGAYLWWWWSAQLNKDYETYFYPLKPLYSISSSSKTQYSTPQIIFLTQHEWSSIPSTRWLFLPNLVAAQLWNSPRLLPKNCSWLLPRQQIFWNSHSTEAENLWSLNVMPVHKQFTFYPRAQYDWINYGGHMYKNTTYQNIIMNYLEFIFLNCAAVMSLTPPLTFWCLSKFQFPFTWW